MNKQTEESRDKSQENSTVKMWSGHLLI
jgi:hypothetical protein